MEEEPLFLVGERLDDGGMGSQAEVCRAPDEGFGLVEPEFLQQGVGLGNPSQSPDGTVFVGLAFVDGEFPFFEQGMGGIELAALPSENAGVQEGFDAHFPCLGGKEVFGATFVIEGESVREIGLQHFGAHEMVRPETVVFVCVPQEGFPEQVVGELCAGIPDLKEPVGQHAVEGFGDVPEFREFARDTPFVGVKMASKTCGDFELFDGVGLALGFPEDEPESGQPQLVEGVGQFDGGTFLDFEPGLSRDEDAALDPVSDELDGKKRHSACALGNLLTEAVVEPNEFVDEFEMRLGIERRDVEFGDVFARQHVSVGGGLWAVLLEIFAACGTQKDDGDVLGLAFGKKKPHEIHGIGRIMDVVHPQNDGAVMGHATQEPAQHAVLLLGVGKADSRDGVFRIVMKPHQFEHGKGVVVFRGQTVFGKKLPDAFQSLVAGEVLTLQGIHHGAHNARCLNVILVMQGFERVGDGELVRALREPLDDAGFSCPPGAVQDDAALFVIGARRQNGRINQVPFGIAVHHGDGAQPPESQSGAEKLSELVVKRLSPPRFGGGHLRRICRRPRRGETRTVDLGQRGQLVHLFVPRLGRLGLL